MWLWCLWFEYVDDVEVVIVELYCLFYVVGVVEKFVVEEVGNYYGVGVVFVVLCGLVVVVLEVCVEYGEEVGGGYYVIVEEWVCVGLLWYDFGLGQGYGCLMCGVVCMQQVYYVYVVYCGWWFWFVVGVVVMGIGVDLWVEQLCVFLW